MQHIPGLVVWHCAHLMTMFSLSLSASSFAVCPGLVRNGARVLLFFKVVLFSTWGNTDQTAS